MAKDLEKNLDKVSQEVSKAAEDVKGTMNDVGGRWKKSPIEEKITVIMGIVLGIVGATMAGFQILASKLFWGIVLLVLGILLFAGYFNKWLKPLFHSTRKSSKQKEEKVEPTKPSSTKKSSKK
jgi:uncharacterized protein YacL